MSESQQLVRASEEHTAEASLPGAVGLSEHRGSGRAISPHSHKFLLVTAVLAGVAVAALVLAAAILISGASGGPTAAWSSWSPPDSGIAGERDIADEVAPFYRASPSAQLVVVTVQNISGSGSSNGGTQLAVRDASTGSLSAVPGNSAVYSLCGVGSNCAIAGTPSSNRELLLRREALELALYTFKYIGNIDNVVAILPPGQSTTNCTGICPKPPSAHATQATTPLDTAVVFQRQALAHFLDRPLRQTLPEQLPPTVSEMPSAPEAELVSVLTGQALYQQQMIQAQDGSNVLVLSPLPAQ